VWTEKSYCLLLKVKYQKRYRIIKFLISETLITARVKGWTGEAFYSRIGIPQGDALSPVLFIIYLEHVMRTVQNEVQPRDERRIFMITHYADDTDFITDRVEDQQVIAKRVPEVMPRSLFNC
jgi:hypothetical protein